MTVGRITAPPQVELTPAPPDAALPVETPLTGAASGRTGSRGLRALRAEIRRRLSQARALEAVPPETHGFSIRVAEWLFLVTCSFYRWYFRTRCYGIERLPAGPVLLIANHGSHVLAWDGANILSACLLDARPPRLVHGMAEHRLMELPVLGRAARRIGAVDGDRAACMALLRSGATVLAFPEGTRALARSFRDRYRLAPFGHGFAHVALATGVPIVPIAVVGAEEEAPLLANPEWLKRLVRTPVAPITPTIVVPLPVRYRLHFGNPMWFRGPVTPEHVASAVAHVRQALEGLLEHGLAARRHVFF